MNRRQCIILFSALLLLAGCFHRTPPPPATGVTEPNLPHTPIAYDLVIRGGIVIDGTGSPGKAADLAIKGDRIAVVGRLGPYTAKREINATGLVVAPGFINPHSHTHDFINPFKDYDANASLMQGITTELGGVDGRSPLPIGTFLSQLEQIGTGVNFGLFVGQGSVRQQVMGRTARGPASVDQLEGMKRLVREAMTEGAFGLSTGLEYEPGSFAAQPEVQALVAETKGFGGVYSTHLRSEGDRIVEALEEALAISKGAGVPLNLSHFKIVKQANWGKEEQLIQRIEQAIGQGQQIVADIYPYLAPDYAVNRPLNEVAALVSPEYLVISIASDQTVVGKSVAALARQRNQPAEQVIRNLSTDKALRVVALVNSERAMIRFLQSPWSLVSTDGEAQPKLSSAAEALAYSFHRRSYGSYPRLLGHYVREERILTLENAIRKATGAVADALGIKERGYVKPNYYADLVLLDPAGVADQTTWLKPQEYPSGIRYVLVNGSFAVDEGERSPGRPGRVVRKGE